MHHHFLRHALWNVHGLVGLFILIFPSVVTAQGQPPTVYFQAEFEDRQVGPLFQKFVGGNTINESITLDSVQPCLGQSSAKISFTPTDGRYWYYKIPMNLTVNPNLDLILKASLKLAPQGTTSPSGQLFIAVSYDTFSDSNYTQRLAHDSVAQLGSVTTSGTWETLRSRPFNLVREEKAKRGLVTAYVKLKSIFIGAVNQPLQQDLTVWADHIRLADATEGEKLTYRKMLYQGYKPSVYPIQADHFPYGFWGTLSSGHYKWHTYLQFIPKQQRYLCAIETLIASNADAIFSETIDSADPSHLAEVLQASDVAYRWGIRTIAQTYLTPYYNHQKSLAQCAREIAQVIPQLKERPEILAYYHMDEPRADAQSMEYWLWGKQTINAIDPTRPVTGFQNTMTTIQFYAPTEDTLPVDIYPLQVPSSQRFDIITGGQMPLLETALKSARQEGSRATWPILWSAGSVFSSGFYARMPSPAETRLMAFTSMAHGARGLFHFAFMSPLTPDTSMREGLVTTFNSVYQPQYDFGTEVLQLGDIVPIYGPVLLGTQSDSTATLPLTAPLLPSASDGTLSIGYGYNRGLDYDVLVCYNRDTLLRRQGTFTLPAERLQNRNLYALMTDQAVERDDNGRWAVTLEPGEGVIYLIAATDVYQRVRNECANRQYRTLSRKLNFELPELENNSIDVTAMRGLLQQADASAAINQSLEALALAHQAQGLMVQATSTHPDLVQAQALIRSIGESYTAISRAYALYLAAHHQTMNLPDDVQWRQWTVGMVQMSDTLVLLRNAVYAGRLVSATPLLVQLNNMMRLTRLNVNSGSYRINDLSVPDQLLKQADALGISAMNLLVTGSPSWSKTPE